MKILVTGGAGFIGTNFVYHMVERGYLVCVLDKLTYAGGRDNLAPLGRKVELIVGDVCDAKAVARALKGIDWVVHFAAESHNTRSETDPELFYRTNVTGTRVLLEQARRAKIKKLIHVSTDEVYGSIKSGYFSENDKKKGAGQATSAYSKSKALADDLVLEFGTKGLPVVVARPTNNFGPWQFPEKALPRWITNLILGEKIPLWGKGWEVRDWLFAPLTAQAIEFLLERGLNGEAYNIAANHQPEITNRQAAEWICQALKKDPAHFIQHIPDPRLAHDFRYALNTDKLEKLGFKPKTAIKKEFQQTVRWYQNHLKWWRQRKAAAEEIYRK